MQISSGKPARTLAVDTRFNPQQIEDDQVWEFNDVSGEPAALSLQTTYGLRCRGMKVFPRFTLGNTTLTDPGTFFQPAMVQKRLSDYLSITCSPFPSIDVELEYWVPSSTVLCGRAIYKNSGASSITMNFDWAVLLQPEENGHAMNPVQMGVNLVLSGQTADLAPVFFLTGGPAISERSYPALMLDLTIPAGTERRVSWALAALDAAEASVTLARQATAFAWDVEILKREMQEKRQIFRWNSGDEVMDDLVHESQVKARQCILPGPKPSNRWFLYSKRTVETNLAAGNEKKQVIPVMPASVFDVWHFSRIALPIEPQTIRDFLFNFIDTRQDDNSLPWTIQTDGAPSRALMTPLLAGIACDLAPYLAEDGWPVQIYAPLLNSFKKWFPERWPTWQNPLQTGLDTAPQYARWNKEDTGIDLDALDSPALGAFLFHECKALIQLGEMAGKHEDHDWLVAQSEEIKTHVMSAWNEEKGNFHYRDIANGCQLPGKEVASWKSNGTFSPRIAWKGSRRLLLRCEKPQGFNLQVQVHLQGITDTGEQEENIRFSRGQFIDGTARYTSKNCYTRILSVTVSGLESRDRLIIHLAGFEEEDISLLLPLWAGLLSDEQAKNLMEKTLLPRYLSEYGLSNLPLDRYPQHEHIVIPLWNELICEGLLHYGMREEASKVMKALLNGIKAQWQMNGVVNDAILANSGRGIGNRDGIGGLAAVTLCLRCLGIEFANEGGLIFGGLNKYFGPITVQYGKAMIKMSAEETLVTSLNGSKLAITEPGHQKIVLP